MPLRPRQASRSIFNISMSQIDSAYGVLETDMLAEIQRMRALGIADAEIFNRISDSLNNSLDLFSKFKGAVEKELDIVVGKTAQLESNVALSEQEKLRWELDPTVEEHCVDCLRNSASDQKSFDEWSLLGLPGMGNTQCGSYCKCTLT